MAVPRVGQRTCLCDAAGAALHQTLYASGAPGTRQPSQCGSRRHHARRIPDHGRRWQRLAEAGQPHTVRYRVLLHEALMKSAGVWLKGLLAALAGGAIASAAQTLATGPVQPAQLKTAAITGAALTV